MGTVQKLRRCGRVWGVIWRCLGGVGRSGSARIRVLLTCKSIVNEQPEMVAQNSYPRRAAFHGVIK